MASSKAPRPLKQNESVSITGQIITPSGFSIFKDSLKEQVGTIYSNIKFNLPTLEPKSLDDLSSDEEDSDSDNLEILSIDRLREVQGGAVQAKEKIEDIPLPAFLKKSTPSTSAAPSNVAVSQNNASSSSPVSFSSLASSTPSSSNALASSSSKSLVATSSSSSGSRATPVSPPTQPPRKVAWGSSDSSDSQADLDFEKEQEREEEARRLERRRHLEQEKERERERERAGTASAEKPHEKQARGKQTKEATRELFGTDSIDDLFPDISPEQISKSAPAVGSARQQQFSFYFPSSNYSQFAFDRMLDNLGIDIDSLLDNPDEQEDALLVEELEDDSTPSSSLSSSSSSSSYASSSRPAPTRVSSSSSSSSSSSAPSVQSLTSRPARKAWVENEDERKSGVEEEEEENVEFEFENSDDEEAEANFHKFLHALVSVQSNLRPNLDEEVDGHAEDLSPAVIAQKQEEERRRLRNAWADPAPVSPSKSVKSSSSASTSVSTTLSSSSSSVSPSNSKVPSVASSSPSSQKSIKPSPSPTSSSSVTSSSSSSAAKPPSAAASIKSVAAPAASKGKEAVYYKGRLVPAEMQEKFSGSDDEEEDDEDEDIDAMWRQQRAMRKQGGR